ncbi:hypothetical protein EVAR_89535_1 [Eumeta japonica]|uniref:Uncharacterized protein n=1 Tax=Eumeta variegata TaxID=151549 RepID=A0A4C1Y5K1_EUMVA|nr:hypothetical protein EVAR_89535_1 [Eumeta japonica]
MNCGDCLECKKLDRMIVLHGRWSAGVQLDEGVVLEPDGPILFRIVGESNIRTTQYTKEKVVIDAHEHSQSLRSHERVADLMARRRITEFSLKGDGLVYSRESS